MAVAAAVTSSTARIERRPIDHKVDLPTKRPLVIAHRGSSGTLPEHTIQAYQRAIEEGADVIECDVTLTQDLVPVCLHENWLDTTTDVDERPEFIAKRRNRTLASSDGSQASGHFLSGISKYKPTVQIDCLSCE
jgi:glycerophosphoryl diester phosphodiesterase